LLKKRYNGHYLYFVKIKNCIIMKKKNLFRRITLGVLVGLFCLNVFAIGKNWTDCTYGGEPLEDGNYGIADVPEKFIQCSWVFGTPTDCPMGLIYCMANERCELANKASRIGTYYFEAKD